MCRMRLWHPESPGVHVTVDVRWYRVYWAVKSGFATNSEVLREYNRKNKIQKMLDHEKTPAWTINNSEV